jgi:glycosyltransferase (activator-dependent family)
MRILFAVIPEKTIFMSMVPLAWALRTAGHEVHVACQPGFAEHVTQAGLTAVPVGRASSATARLRTAFYPEDIDVAGLPSPYKVAEPSGADLGWDRVSADYAHMVNIWHRRDNYPMIIDLVDYARFWEPDLIIWEPLTYAGSIAAKACGAAHARLLWSIDVFGVTRRRFLELRDEQPEDQRIDPFADWLGGYARKYGFEFSEDMVTGQFTIDELPPSLAQQADGLHYAGLQYIPYGGAAVIPNWLRTRPERPRVALTLGLSTTEIFSRYTVNIQDILDNLADLDFEIVATIAEEKQKYLTRVPDNTRIVSYVPLQALTATCDAVINHAGPGTFLTVARDGVPQLTIPRDFDEPELARRAENQGGSLCIQAADATAGNIRESLLRLLNEPRFREGATELRDELLTMPSPNDFVPALEQLITKHRGA